MISSPFIQIRSPKLGIMPGEDEELVNEGMYGKSLAGYLQAQLAQRGYQTPGVACEDWGWWVTVAGLPFACGLCIHGRRIDDTDELDLCVTIPTPIGRKWFWGRFRFIDTTADVERLHQTLRSIFDSDPDITVAGETQEFPFS